MAPHLIHDCPRCGSGPQKKAGRYKERQRLRCKGCGHTHIIEDRKSRTALHNHPTPPCPSCGHPDPSRNGIDYRYEKQAYLCPCCKQTFRIQLTRFAPVEQMDAILDAAVVESHRLAKRLLAAGAFTLGRSLSEQQALAKWFAAMLAGELYLTRIGEANHQTLEDAMTAAVATLNRTTAPRTAVVRKRKREYVVPLARILSVLADYPPLEKRPIYSLDKAAAMRGQYVEVSKQSAAEGVPDKWLKAR